GIPASASFRKPIICSSENHFFTSNLLLLGYWTLNRCATQLRGDVGGTVENKPRNGLLESAGNPTN
ncbi:MAG: hypothetical protein EXR84_12235, partial [Gammaproteobacteria bacterium]|nr:hypothetical protein [Gammaproteobacteria bacterium]